MRSHGRYADEEDVLNAAGLQSPRCPQVTSLGNVPCYQMRLMGSALGLLEHNPVLYFRSST